MRKRLNDLLYKVVHRARDAGVADYEEETGLKREEDEWLNDNSELCERELEVAILRFEVVLDAVLDRLKP